MFLRSLGNLQVIFKSIFKGAMKILTSTDKGVERVCTKGVFAQSDLTVSELALDPMWGSTYL